MTNDILFMKDRGLLQERMHTRSKVTASQCKCSLACIKLWNYAEFKHLQDAEDHAFSHFIAYRGSSWGGLWGHGLPSENASPLLEESVPRRERSGATSGCINLRWSHCCFPVKQNLAKTKIFCRMSPEMTQLFKGTIAILSRWLKTQ